VKLSNALLVLALILMICARLPLAHGQDGREMSSATALKVVSDDTSRLEAERLWELAIAAKGGRERLYAVRNLQMSTREHYWHMLKRFRYIEESLHVFPDKAWGWNDQRDSIFGLSIQVRNLEDSINWAYSDRGKGGSINPIMEGGRGMKSGFIDFQLLYFMETKWVKPVPVSVERGEVGRHDVNIVHTRVNEYPRGSEHVAFALDRKTHLPLQIIHYTVTHGKEYSGSPRLSDYVDVDGIKMPTKVGTIKRTYRINVEYDPQIFERKPDVSAGIEAWKKKETTSSQE
jgi:hypothetical protein